METDKIEKLVTDIVMLEKKIIEGINEIAVFLVEESETYRDALNIIHDHLVTKNHVTPELGKFVLDEVYESILAKATKQATQKE